MDIQLMVKNLFEEMVDDRIDKAAYEKVKQDEEYVKASNKEDAIFKVLMGSLDNEEQKLLLFDLEAAYNRTEAIYLEYCYVQGLKDSFTMRQEFRRISNIGIEDNEKIS